MKTKLIALAVVMSSLFSAAAFADDDHQHDSDDSAEVSKNSDKSSAEKAHSCDGAADDDEMND
ncbi:hypothetical protein [Winslowiella iniecta]|uniref:Pentapeptide MXKDX repeat protein n=1 Tax=Winslowiella iniecta TaxID=1560201 RepID=A0A0L7T093_9GAMM|nr:hypothetical protein [Winslowiella iniecta]KOC87662.1 hypothetical protein NG43_21280 [Winslowiella iniecta]KOC88864.1 hypothetical protein NG42_14500 [Winslowiella iniecta]